MLRNSLGFDNAFDSSAALVTAIDLEGNYKDTHIQTHTDFCNFNQDMHSYLITLEILKQFSLRATLGN